MNETRLRERFARVADTSDDSDWEDVVRRAKGRRARRRPLALAAAVAVLVAVPALALGGRMVGVFADEGTPIPTGTLVEPDREMLVRMCARVRLVSDPGKRPRLRCIGGTPRVEEMANDGTWRYLKVTLPDGRVCLLRASLQRHGRGGTLGGGGCAPDAKSAAALFPSPERPITVEIAGGMDLGDRRPYVLWISGLAGEGVERVRLVGRDGAALERRVRGRAYRFDQLPKREWTDIVALAEDGDEVYRERIGIGGTLRPHPRPPRALPPRRPRPRRPPSRVPDTPPLQQASAQGTSVEVFRSGVVRLRFAADARAYRLVALRPDLGASLECLDVAYGAGHWETLSSGAGSEHLARTLVLPLWSSPFHASATPPFDVCSVKGHYGHRWNDPRGTHDAAELPFTELGRRFVAQRATARDLAYFVRSPALRAIRRALKRGGTAPTAASIARRYPARVVALARRGGEVDAGEIGVWSDGRQSLEVSARASDGRRLFVRLERGRIGAHNLHRLALVF